MVWGCLRRHARTAPLCVPYNIDRKGARYVLQMYVAFCIVSQNNVARNNYVFGGRRPASEPEFYRPLPLVHLPSFGESVFLAVVHDKQPEHFSIDHCIAHEFRALHARAVVGNRPNAKARE